MITRGATARDGTLRVTFTTTDHHHAPVSLVGDFNGWDPHVTPMTASGSGMLSATVDLPVGRRHRFRYLAAGDRWFNDEAADDYVPNDHGGHDSVVDLTQPGDSALDDPVAQGSESEVPAAESRQAALQNGRPRSSQSGPGRKRVRQPAGGRRAE